MDLKTHVIFNPSPCKSSPEENIKILKIIDYRLYKSLLPHKSIKRQPQLSIHLSLWMSSYLPLMSGSGPFLFPSTSYKGLRPTCTILHQTFTEKLRLLLKKVHPNCQSQIGI
jgi:hypothetical protein